MENFKLPAYPATEWSQLPDGTIVYNTTSEGFTKLEKAALMIAQGFMSNSRLQGEIVPVDLASLSVLIAKAVLEEANK